MISMIEYLFEQAEDTAFTFPTIYEGRPVKITVVWSRGHYQVLMNDNHSAFIKLAPDNRSWFITGGELNDPDLVNEIGERIKAKYF